MTTTIIKHKFDNHQIAQRSEDGYVNLTQLCKAGEKKVNDYMRRTETEELLAALALDTGIPATSDEASSGVLVEVLQGGNKAQGTWAHPEVAIDCAMWVSIPLRIWANRTLVKMIYGQPQPETLQPQSTTPLLLPEISQHNLAKKLVDQQAVKTGLQHQLLYRQAYAELNYLFGYNINTKKITTSKLDRIEQDKHLGNLIAIMQKLWG